MTFDPTSEKMQPSVEDMEKGSMESPAPVPKEGETQMVWGSAFLTKFGLSSVEVRGITPIPEEERTDARAVNVFSLWFSMSLNLLP
jgi:hypothetical protein